MKFENFKSVENANKRFVKVINEISEKKYNIYLLDEYENINYLESDGGVVGLGFENEIKINASVIKNCSLEYIVSYVVELANKAINENENYFGKEMYFNLCGGYIDIR